MNRLLKAGLAACVAAGMIVGSATAAGADPVDDVEDAVAGPLEDAEEVVGPPLEDAAWTLVDVLYMMAGALEDGAWTLAGLFGDAAETLEDGAYTIADTVGTAYETVEPVLEEVGPITAPPVCHRQTLPEELGGDTIQAGYCPPGA